MGNYFSAIIVFVSVTALTLFSFFVADLYYSNSTGLETGASANLSWILLLAGIGIATALAGHIAIATRKQLISAQLRSDRDKLENLLVSARKLEAMAQLVGGIAHDFNNILMTVSGYASLALAKTEDMDDPEMQEYLNLVTVSADKGTVLIKRLLSFSRGKSHRRGNSTELVPAVEDTLALLSQLLPQDINIQVAIAEHLPALKIDSLFIEQVITNLVINARDAIGHNGTIKINLLAATVANLRCNACHQTFAGEFVGLTVSDTGKGLTLENVDDIFQPFYTTKNEGSGAGLGMALLQNLVHNNGGHIELLSGPGTGTVVTIYLPLPVPAVGKTQTN